MGVEKFVVTVDRGDEMSAMLLRDRLFSKGDAMKHYRLSDNGIQKYNEHGGAINGKAFVGEDNIVRWFTDDERRAMEGVGHWDSASGYAVYESCDDVPVHA